MLKLFLSLVFLFLCFALVGTVFVGNLPWSTTDEDLQQIFAPYEPYDCHVKTNMAGRSRGFGILRYGE